MVPEQRSRPEQARLNEPGVSPMRIGLGLAGLIFLLLFFRGWSDGDTFEAATPTRLSEQDAGRTIELQVNTQFDIVLDGYPTQGCRWEF